MTNDRVTTLEDRLWALLQYGQNISLAAALAFIAAKDAERPECCSMEFSIGACPAHPWRGTHTDEVTR